jgi:hypothetical protein
MPQPRAARSCSARRCRRTSPRLGGSGGSHCSMSRVTEHPVQGRRSVAARAGCLCMCLIWLCARPSPPERPVLVRPPEGDWRREGRCSPRESPWVSREAAPPDCPVLAGPDGTTPSDTSITPRQDQCTRSARRRPRTRSSRMGKAENDPAGVSEPGEAFGELPPDRCSTALFGENPDFVS